MGSIAQTPRDPVGTDEHRDAAMALYQVNRYRGLAMLVSSYRKMHSNSEVRALFEERPPCLLP